LTHSKFHHWYYGLCQCQRGVACAQLLCVCSPLAIVHRDGTVTPPCTAGVIGEALEFLTDEDLGATTTTSAFSGSKPDGSLRMAMRGLLELLSVSLVGDGRDVANAPHRRLSRLQDARAAVSMEDTATWYMAVHHTSMGSFNVNCSAQHLEPGCVAPRLFAARGLVLVPIVPIVLARRAGFLGPVTAFQGLRVLGRHY
jgi:hypothetical protein